MTIIAARRYFPGQPSADIAIHGGAREAPPAGGFDWIGLAEPDAAQMELLHSQYGLHPLAVEDALNPNQMPKVEAYGAQLFMVARTAELVEGDNIAYGQVAIFLGSDFLITVRSGAARDYRGLRAKLERADTQRLLEGPDFVAHAVLDYVVDGFVPIMERLEETVNHLEEAAIETFPQASTIRRIFRLRRRIRRFERIIGPMEEMCERLATVDLPAIDTDAHVWFRDVLDHLRRSMRRILGLKETLASIVETASLLESQRQGIMARKLAAWAAILAVPTAIAGIYGMNFENMPELKWHYGYYATVGVMGTACVGLFWRFRRAGWV